MDPVRHFDAQYAEQAVLDDGTQVTLRLLRPTDKALLLAGFAHLSARSRYRRFLAQKARLSDRELRYLTELDHEMHFALAALTVDAQGREAGVGIARFVRQPDRPEIAEPAVVVIDSMQGRGLGRLLCRRLAEAARERGVTSFRCEVLASNEPMRALIDQLSPHAHIEQNGGSATIEFTLTAPGPAAATTEPAAGSMVDYLLRLASRGAMVVLHRALARWTNHPA